MSLLNDIINTIQHPVPPYNPTQPASAAYFQTQPSSAAQHRELLNFASKAGEIHGAAVQDALNLGKDPVVIMKIDLALLESKGLISQAETALLGQLVDVVAGRASVEEISVKVANLHKQISSLKEAGPLALAISGVAVDSTATQTRFPRRVERAVVSGGSGIIANPDGVVALADVMGCIGGARLAIAFTLNPWVPVAGGLIGAAAASVAAAI